MPEIIIADTGKYHSTVKDIINEINRYNCFDFIKVISNYSSKFHKNSSPGEPSINIVSLSKLASLVIKNNPNGGNELTFEVFLEINKMINSVNEIINSNASKDDFIKYYLFTSNTQFIFNRTDLPYSIINLWYVFKILKDEKNLLGEKLNDIFYKHMLVVFENYMIILFIIYATSLKDGVLNVKSLKKQIKEISVFNDFNTVLGFISASIVDIQSNLRNPKYNISEYELLNFNILRDYPIIKYNDELYYIPIIHYLCEKYTSHIYYTILERYSQYERNKNPKNTNPYDNDFSRTFGYANELLLTKFLNQINYKLTCCDEFEYKPGYRSADFQCFEGKSLILFQLKNKRATLNTQHANLDNLVNDIELAIVKPFIQNLKLLNDKIFITALKRKLSFIKYSKVYSIIVLTEEFYGIEFPYIENIIHKRISEEKIKYSMNKQIKTIITSLASIEKAVDYSHLSKTPLISLFDEYDVYYRQPQINKFRNSFNEFMMGKMKDIGNHISFIDPIWDDFKQTLDKYVNNRFSLDV